jgi:hypothetical protein
MTEILRKIESLSWYPYMDLNNYEYKNTVIKIKYNKCYLNIKLLKEWIKLT